MKAEITLDYGNSTIAQAIAKAVSPDNLRTPTGLLVKTVCIDGKVTTTIAAQRKLPTLIATIDDLLFCVSVAEKTVQTARKME